MARIAASVGPRVAGLRRLRRSPIEGATPLSIIAAVSLALAAAFVCGPAHAGAWPMDSGKTQAIVKFEVQRSSEAFDEAGQLVPIAVRHDMAADLFVERGITERLTAQGKLYWASVKEDGLSQTAYGNSELGARWTTYQGSKGVLSFYTGLTLPVAGAQKGQAGFEARVLAGRAARIGRRKLVADLQLATLTGSGYGRETRLEGTLGLELTENWSLMAQLQGGQIENGTAWLKDEISITRNLGQNSLQIGWRQTPFAKNFTKASGPIVGLWRRF